MADESDSAPESHPPSPTDVNPTAPATGARQTRRDAHDRARRAAAYRRYAARGGQDNLAERLFPGPSERMSQQLAEHIDDLLTPFEGRQPRHPKDSARLPATDVEQRESAGTPPSARSPRESLNLATHDDIATLGETLDKQNERLQAILSSSLDTQQDARATAQNSRTFAWAGTAIAALTLIATVISVIAVLQH